MGLLIPGTPCLDYVADVTALISNLSIVFDRSVIASHIFSGRPTAHLAPTSTEERTIV